VGLRDKDRTGLGYTGAIAVSALGHAAFLYLVLFVLPHWFTAQSTPAPVYTVKIVDSLPAGDLGTHLPRLARHRRSEARHSPPPEESPDEAAREKPAAPSKGPKIDAPNEDRNAIALNITATPVATPPPTETPTPTPEPTPTVAETPAPTAKPTREPTAKPTHKPRPTAQPTPRPKRREANQIREKHRKGPPPKPTPKVMLAHKHERTPNVKEQLARVREQLLKEHLRQLAQKAKNQPEAADEGEDEDEGEEAPAAARTERGGGSGPVAANVASGGRGYGIGSGTGSAGILKDPEFLLYYQKIQERIKDAWSFYGGNKELTTTVDFAIGPDGKLTGITVAHSSNNASFDQSVVRAVRRAAPFPPPPQKYRDQFAQGIQAVFKLGELSS
jgi:TonB family protein